MPPVYYDLHIHTALSPCAANDMVPCDIVGMAILNGLDVIAITDHNSLANAKAVCGAAIKARETYKLKDELIVLPGIEVTTSEEVHVLTVFDDCDTAQAFETELAPFFSQEKNREDIFGSQLILDSNDTVTAAMDRMLIAPAAISFDALYELTLKHGGAFVPAHVDRGSFSIMSNLGFLPPELDIAAVEFTSRNVYGEIDEHDYSLFPDKNIILSSDAHRLHEINEKNHFFLLPERSAGAVIKYLKSARTFSG